MHLQSHYHRELLPCRIFESRAYTRHVRLRGYALLRVEVMFAQLNGCVRRNMGYNFGVDLPVNYAAASVDNLIGDNRRSLSLHTT